jgi:hypothetical protein
VVWERRPREETRVSNENFLSVLATTLRARIPQVNRKYRSAYKRGRGRSVVRGFFSGTNKGKNHAIHSVQSGRHGPTYDKPPPIAAKEQPFELELRDGPRSPLSGIPPSCQDTAVSGATFADSDANRPSTSVKCALHPTAGQWGSPFALE